MWEWLIGLGSIGTLGIASWFLGLPTLLGIVNSALKIVTPFLTSITEFIVWYFEELWESIKLVYKNPNLMVLLLTIGIVTGAYGMHISDCNPVEIVRTTTDSGQPTKEWKFNFGSER